MWTCGVNYFVEHAVGVFACLNGNHYIPGIGVSCACSHDLRPCVDFTHTLGDG